MIKSKQQIIFFCLVFLVVSCNYFNNKLPDETTLYEQKIKEIDWNKPSSLPILDVCDSISDPMALKNCLLQTVNSTLQATLNEQLNLKAQKNDTLMLNIVITPQNNWQISVNHQSMVSDTLLNVLHKALNNLTIHQPALKHGIPVKCQWQTPLIILVQKPQ